MESGKHLDLDPLVLAGLRAGDPSALAECYRLYGARVYRLCRGLLCQPTDAEDAVQEVFLKLLDRAGQFEGRARFSTWLHRLTVNHCLHRLEKEHRRRADALDRELVDDAATPARRAEGEESRVLLAKLLLRIPPAHRAVLVLRELEGLAYVEIAEVLAVPVGTVMSRLARAREGLARLVPPASTPSVPATTTRTAS